MQDVNGQTFIFTLSVCLKASLVWGLEFEKPYVGKPINPINKKYRDTIAYNIQA